MTAREQLLADEAGAWQAIAIVLDDEVRELRGLLVQLLFAAVERRELIAYAEAAVERRFPTSGASS